MFTKTYRSNAQIVSGLKSVMKKMVLSFNRPVIPSLALCLFVANTLFAAPSIECEQPKFDFGTVIGQEPIAHEFIIWNKGDEPLVISKIKNCCGVETTVVPMTIAPGTNAVCTSVFTTKNRNGKQDKTNPAGDQTISSTCIMICA